VSLSDPVKWRGKVLSMMGSVPGADRWLEGDRQHLLELDGRLEDLETRVKARRVGGDLARALMPVVGRTRYEIRRILDSLEGPDEVLAWRARNLFELRLWALFISQSAENARQWLAEAVTDEKELLTAFLKSPAREVSDEKQVAAARLQELEAASSHIGPRLREFELAKVVEEGEGGKGTVIERDVFFQLYSKFVHPSSLLVNGTLDGMPLRSWASEFRARAYMYADNVAYITQQKLCP
jgi:hypothetical protein